MLEIVAVRMIQRLLIRYLRASLPILASALLAKSASAASGCHAPSLAAHESLYGSETKRGVTYSVERLSLRIIGDKDVDSVFVVQCFFFKKPKDGETPKIGDTALFEVTHPHGNYEVMAAPVRMSAAANSKKKKKSKKAAAKNAPPPSSSKFPWEGYVVRLLHDQKVLKISASSHPLERLAREHPELLEKAAAMKSARHLQAADLLKK
jgi:hypothetical protein